MPVIFAGTSTADFQQTGAPTSTTTSTNKDTNVGEGFILATDTCYVDIAGESDLWVSFYANKLTLPAGNTDGVGFFNRTFSTSNPLFNLTCVTATRNLLARYWNGSAITTFATGSGSDAQNLHRYDIHIKIADSAGIVEIYRDGILHFDFTSVGSDTKLTSATTIDRIVLGGMGAGNTSFSSLIIADEDTRSMLLTQLLPTGDGADTSWTGTFADVDETGYSDADLITSSTVGQHETFTFPDIGAGLAGRNVETVILSGRARASGSPGSIHGVARVSSVDYTSPPDTAAPASYGPWQAFFDINPSTGLPWTTSEINAAEFGVRAHT